MELFEMKQEALNIGKQLESVKQKKVEAAVNPEEDAVEKMELFKEQEKALQARFDTMQTAIKEKEAVQKARLVDAPKKAKTPEESYNNAFASMVKATMSNQSVGREVYQAFGEDTLLDNDTAGGGNFLPKTVSSNIITTPAETNPLRDISTVTAITNLEIPRLATALDDDNFVSDGESAKELKAKGEMVSFSRNKFKVGVGISETVLMGSNASITSYVQAKLQDAFIAKERNVAFATNPTKENEKHMSFYDDSVGIKKISGDDLRTGIFKAIADLPDAYRQNATIVMSYMDYINILEGLANNSATLYGAQPEQVLGKPVVFTDAAVKPIVGNFAYSQYNYDLPVFFDQDKDIIKGVNSFVVTAYFDHQILMSNAFRIVDVANSNNVGK